MNDNVEYRICKVCGRELKRPRVQICEKCKKKAKAAKGNVIPIRNAEHKQCMSCDYQTCGNLSGCGLYCDFLQRTGIAKITAFPDYLPPPNCSAYKKRVVKNRRE